MCLEFPKIDLTPPIFASDIKKMEGKMNLNKLAQTIAKKEKGKEQVSIAQIKEIMKIMFKELKKFKVSELVAVLNRY